MVNPISEDGVLTDFDVATIVDKDATDPLHGVDYTGTMTFMSLELLTEVGQQDRVPRLYRHDLESFCWVLFWICYCYENGKLRPRYPCTEWINVTPSICGAVKGGVLNRMRKVTATKSYIQYQSSLHRLMGYWSQFYVTMGFSKLDKSTSIEDVGSNLDLSHWDDMVEEDFEEPSDFQMRCAILNRLPRSKEVVMPWPQARGYIPTAIL
ncbi:hypothetical protein QCA50_009034 [Cerrena zonata]|uniref:Fungal-type protein kinase domain-containing protein n=1 Tax=Cerrena zonata TaxID=2478898 RepID=A0AAW0G9J7_9APHY